MAGALRRREWFEEQMARLIWAALAPHMKAPIAFDALLGRKPGTSRVPGYREEDAGGR